VGYIPDYGFTAMLCDTLVHESNPFKACGLFQIMACVLACYVVVCFICDCSGSLVVGVWVDPRLLLSLDIVHFVVSG